MTEPIDHRLPNEAPRDVRVRSAVTWGWAVAVVLAWVFMILLAPIGREFGWGGAESIYSFFGYVCHQIPERTLHLDAHPMAVCSRCFGVYGGLLGGLLAYPLVRKIEDTEPIRRRWLFLSLVPIGLDWSLTIFGIWENTHLTRVATGAILGIACAVYIVPALVEIRQNLAVRRSPT